MAVDPVAAGGFSSAAATYARIRPTYARGAVGAVADLVRGRGRAAPVLDVAAGTGILTGQLSRSGLRCTGLEPLEPMARQMQLALPSVPVVLGTAEALPFAAASFEVVTVAQAFHWFDAPAALAEIRRVLVAGGDLVLVWNVRDESVPWVAELTDLVGRRTGGRPYQDHRERPWEDVVAESGRFGPLESRRFPNPVPTDRAGVVDRLRSTSFVAALDPGPREALLDEARELLAGHPELAGRFDYPHETVLYRCRSLG